MRLKYIFISVLLSIASSFVIEKEADVRLVGGVLPSEGRVEIYLNGEWGTICDDQWDIYSQQVVCHQLGYPSAAVLLATEPVIPGTGPIWMDEVKCHGNETKLTECVYSTTNDCTHAEDAIVTCITGPMEVRARLVDGENPWEGRLEIEYNGIFGSVCDDRFKLQDAAVICRQLGFWAAKELKRVGHYGPGDHKTILDEVSCTGSETNIALCAHRPWGENDCADHTEDIGIVCYPEEPIFDIGSIRLKGGSTPAEGNVQIYFEGWGSVCDNNWDVLDALVVCHELGFPSAQAFKGGKFFPSTRVEFWLENVQCTGGETGLYDCGNNGIGVHSCTPGADEAGVICNTGADNVEVRLVDGTTPFEGRVEVNYNGVFRPVCDDLFDINAADVICKSLGHFHAIAVKGESFFGIDSTGFIMDDVVCAGTEDNIAKCAHNFWGIHNCGENEAVGVICSPEAPVNVEGDIRLVGGTDPNEGRVEIFTGRQWMSICADKFWNINDAQVVCHQLGFASAFSATLDGFSVSTMRMSGFSNFGCLGDETSAIDCNSTIIDFESCPSTFSAGVICETGPLAVDVRLVGGKVPHEGRVEVYYENEWGTVCDDSWTKEEADVVCKQLGYGGGRLALPSAFFGEGSGRITLDDMMCLGKETNIALCVHAGWTNHNCQHSEDAGVICFKDLEILPIRTNTLGSMGRVEVYVDDEWGNICDNTFMEVDATVVCRSLGFMGGFLKKNENIDPNIPVFVNDISCEGLEPNLLECEYGPFMKTTCPTGKVLAVMCTEPVEGDIRLHGDTTKVTSGRLEIYRNQEWGTVCDDNFDIIDATVVCKQLGFGDALSVFTWTINEVLDGVKVWMDEVNCPTFATKLEQCDHIPYNSRSMDCTHAEDVAVTCGMTNAQDVVIQLLNGGSEREGTPVIFDQSIPIGSICQRGFDLREAHVICKQLGYRGAAEFTASNAFGTFLPGVIPVVRDLACEGTERNLGRCLGMTLMTTLSCPAKEIAGVVCLEDEQLDIRLTQGTSPNNGRVEIRYGLQRQFGTICDDDFTMENAMVICRQLGYLAAEQFRSASWEYTYANNMPIWLDSVSCTGQEATIEQCLHNGFGNSNCLHSEDVVVSCTNEVPEPPVVVPSTPRGEVRLTNTKILYDGKYMEGLVEINFGTWGTICDDGWDLLAAEKICKQLGYHTALAAVKAAGLGAGTGKIWLDNLQCREDDILITDCLFDFDDSDCDHDEDAGVVCVTEDFELPVRLVNGEWEGEGRVEVLFNNTYGTICDDEWDFTDADVVCKQLGYVSAKSAVKNGAFGEGTGPIWMDDIQCIEKVGFCKNGGMGKSDCTHVEDAGVICDPGTAVDITFMGGKLENEGRVEIVMNGETKSICFEGMDLNEGDVICREKGFMRAIDVTFDMARLGTPTAAVTLKCTGLEMNVGDCIMEPINTIDCPKEMVAVVVCAPPQDGDLRLMNGISMIQGRVEVWFDGSWGTVCDDQWDIIDGNVVCKQMGFGVARRTFNFGTYGQGNLFIWMDEVDCKGTEKKLIDCPQLELGYGDCSHSEDASVSCEMSVRLSGGTVPTEGRVEVNYKGEWGTICSDAFEIQDANVVCRQLGYRAATGINYFGEGTGPIWMDEVKCEGLEKQIALCKHEGMGIHDCTHMNDVGIICTL